ncbi:hypothetical protein JB92DRAFT_3098781 [Gautieria morchelliformis]|nr:hypothetical protein JB92DRAFT_3098781 [Gautieria morchelliformis]
MHQALRHAQARRVFEPSNSHVYAKAAQLIGIIYKHDESTEPSQYYYTGANRLLPRGTGSRSDFLSFTQIEGTPQFRDHQISPRHYCNASGIYTVKPSQGFVSSSRLGVRYDPQGISLPSQVHLSALSMVLQITAHFRSAAKSARVSSAVIRVSLDNLDCGQTYATAFPVAIPPPTFLQWYHCAELSSGLFLKPYQSQIFTIFIKFFHTIPRRLPMVMTGAAAKGNVRYFRPLGMVIQAHTGTGMLATSYCTAAVLYSRLETWILIPKMVQSRPEYTADRHTTATTTSKPGNSVLDIHARLNLTTIYFVSYC